MKRPARVALRYSERLTRLQFYASTIPVLIMCALLSSAAAAFPVIELSREYGPPTKKILLSGTGFHINTEVNIYFDSVDETQIRTNANGDFSGAVIHVPRSARPGEHIVKAVDADHATAQQSLHVRTDWRQFHRLDMTRFNPFENVLSPKNVGHLRLRWEFSIGQPADTSPALWNGALYFATAAYGGTDFYALDASSGLLLWDTALGQQVFSSPAVIDGIVYAGGNSLVALNAITGATLWQFKVNYGVTSAPTVVDGVVYFGGGDGRVYALNDKTGVMLWEFGTGGYVSSSPAVKNGVVYVGSYDYNVYALKASDGSLLWNYKTGYEVACSPAVANGTVYISSGDGNVYALDAKTGSKIWTYGPLGGNFENSGPAVWNGIIYVGGGNGMFALAADTGELLWSFAASGVSSSPAVANGVVYFSSEISPSFYAVDARIGTQLWNYSSGYTFSDPIVANGIVYVGFGAFGGLDAFSLPQ